MEKRFLMLIVPKTCFCRLNDFRPIDGNKMKQFLGLCLLQKCHVYVTYSEKMNCTIISIFPATMSGHIGLQFIFTISYAVWAIDDLFELSA